MLNACRIGQDILCRPEEIPKRRYELTFSFPFTERYDEGLVSEPREYQSLSSHLLKNKSHIRTANDRRTSTTPAEKRNSTTEQINRIPEKHLMATKSHKKRKTSSPITFRAFSWLNFSLSLTMGSCTGWRGAEASYMHLFCWMDTYSFTASPHSLESSSQSKSPASRPEFLMLHAGP